MSSASLLNVKLEHRVGELKLYIRFEMRQPWTVLFGPSGSGKTTVLRAIAGFVRPDAGSIRFCGRELVDRDSGVWVPAHQRPVRSAAQHARLFSHMSVMSNVLYGCGIEGNASSAGRPGTEREIAQELLELFRIRELSGRMPRELSGGEQKRVSAARAVLAAATFREPGGVLLLLDEPFVGLDAALRDELLLELHTWVAERKVPVLSVTHDVGEAFLLDAEVVRIDEGRVAAQGPVTEVLADERRRLLARLGETGELLSD
jgi:molybdate transport system ATP-binding protein